MKEFKTSLVSILPATRTLPFISLSFLSFAVPFFLGHSQLITGTLVNAVLFSSAFLLPTNFLLPIALFPSLAVISRGIIFGPFTSFLVYFLPFIWLGNLIYVAMIKKYYKTQGYGASILIAAGGKAMFLFIIANIFFSFHIIPRVFLQSMGINQFITAISGGLLSAIILQKVKNGNTK